MSFRKNKKTQKVKQMEKNEKVRVGIGREVGHLKAEVVEIIDATIEMQMDKEGKEVGEKVTLVCKHPDRESPIEISKVEYRKGKTIKTSGIWFKLDKDGSIPHSSALANLLRNLDAECVEDLRGRAMATTLDDEGYIIGRAY